MGGIMGTSNKAAELARSVTPHPQVECEQVESEPKMSKHEMKEEIKAILRRTIKEYNGKEFIIETTGEQCKFEINVDFEKLYLDEFVKNLDDKKFRSFTSKIMFRADEMIMGTNYRSSRVSEKEFIKGLIKQPVDQHNLIVFKYLVFCLDQHDDRVGLDINEDDEHVGYTWTFGYKQELSKDQMVDRLRKTIINTIRYDAASEPTWDKVYLDWESLSRFLHLFLRIFDEEKFIAYELEFKTSATKNMMEELHAIDEFDDDFEWEKVQIVKKYLKDALKNLDAKSKLRRRLAECEHSLSYSTLHN